MDGGPSVPAVLTHFLTKDVCVAKETYTGRSGYVSAVFPAIFVVTLPESWHRHVWFARSMDHIGANYTLCIMQRPPQAVYESYTAWATAAHPGQKLLSPGELGCLCSHGHLMTLIAKLPKTATGHVLVLEDDIGFRKDFDDLLRTVMASDKPLAPVVLLGSSDWSRTTRTLDVHHGVYDLDKGRPYGTFAYAIARTHAPVLLQQLQTFVGAADHFWSKDVTAVAYPDLVAADRTTSVIRDPMGPGSDAEKTYRDRCGLDSDLCAAYNITCTAALEGGPGALGWRAFRTLATLRARGALPPHTGGGSGSEGSRGDTATPDGTLVRRVVDIACTSTWVPPLWAAMVRDLCMDIDARRDMAVCLAVFNPVGYKAPVTNLRRVLEAMCRTVPVFLMILRYTGTAAGDAEDPDPYADLPPEVSVHTVTGSTVLFHKENLWNLLEARVPATYTKLLFMDADVLFSEPMWYPSISRALDTACVVQPFRTAALLGPSGSSGPCPSGSSNASHVKTAESMAHVAESATPGRWGAPGFALGCRRDWFKSAGGLFDFAVMGGGDLLGMTAIHPPLEPLVMKHISWTHQPYAHEEWRAYRDRAQRAHAALAAANPEVRKAFGCVPLHISHLFHGHAVDRQYDTRHGATRGYVATDFYKNTQGVWEAVDPAKWNAITLSYFRTRREDG